MLTDDPISLLRKEIEQSAPAPNDRSADCPWCESTRRLDGNYCRKCGRRLKEIDAIPEEYRPHHDEAARFAEMNFLRRTEDRT